MNRYLLHKFKNMINWPLGIGDVVEIAPETWHFPVKPGQLHGCVTSVHGDILGVIWNDIMFDTLCYKFGGIHRGYLKRRE